MTKHTYLMKSWHGVYYLRLVQQSSDALGVTKPREIRVSLRTKSRSAAKAKLVGKLFEVQRYGRPSREARMIDDDEILDFDERHALLMRGLTLIDEIGDIDPHDEFGMGSLLDLLLNRRDVRAYIFAHEHREEQQAHTKVRKERLFADARRSQTLPESSSPTSCAPSVVEGTRPKIVVPSAGREPQPLGQAGSDATLMDAIDRFVQQNRSANEATNAKYRSQCLLFAKIIGGAGGRLLSSIETNDIRRYADTLPNFPKKVAPTDPRALEELLALNRPRIGAKTRFSHAQAVNMFLTWCVDQAYPLDPSFRGILKPLLKKPKVVEKDKTFSLDELRLIFDADNYRRECCKRTSDFWLPLMALFTGARQGELCQLYHGDVRQDEQSGVWLFEFNELDEKTLKTSGSMRVVPIHSQLIDLGFLEFCEEAKGNGSQRVFPDLVSNGRGEFGAYSKRFNRFIDDLGLKSKLNSKKGLPLVSTCVDRVFDRSRH